MSKTLGSKAVVHYCKKGKENNKFMAPFDWIIEEIAERLDAKPGSPRWDIITACFGWLAAVSLIVGLVFSFVGYVSLAGYAIGVFSLLIWTALKRDWKKLRKK